MLDDDYPPTQSTESPEEVQAPSPVREPAGTTMSPPEIVDQPTRPAPTEKQIVARRLNGAKSRGPRTETGKAVSRGNAATHGAYAKVLGVITDGPLAEDPREYERFRQDVLESLPRTDTPLLLHLGTRLAQTLWRDQRVWRWEPHAIHNVAAANPDEATSARLERWIWTCETAQQVLRTELDCDPMNDDAWGAVIEALGDHADLSDDDWPEGNPRGLHLLARDQWRSLGLRFIAKVYNGDRDMTMAWLGKEVDDARVAISRADRRSERQAAYAVLTDPISPALARAQAHASNETRKALESYERAVFSINLHEGVLDICDSE